MKKIFVFSAAAALLISAASQAYAGEGNSKIPYETLQKIHGRIKIVEKNPDYKVGVFKEGFPDLRVKVVKKNPQNPGEWQFAETKPDYKIQYVKDNPDFYIMFVDSMPGPVKTKNNK